MRRPLLNALAEGIDVALARPKATAAIGLVGLLGNLVAVAASPVAGAITSAILFAGLVGLFVFALRQRATFQGPYEVLADETIWDLGEPDGSTAVVTKRQRVRFNYEVIAVADYAWGDGDLFAEFRCEYGEPLKRVRDGSREYMIIALDAAKQRNEEADLVSHRTVRNGFSGSQEWIEFEVQKVTHRSSVVIRFPAGRPPTRTTLRRSSNRRTIPAKLVSEGGRKIFQLEERAPRVLEQYAIRWEW